MKTFRHGLRRKAKSHLTVLLLLATIGHVSVSAQQPEPIAIDVINRIKDEGLNRSQVMQTVSYLTDVNGRALPGRLVCAARSNMRSTAWPAGESRVAAANRGVEILAAAGLWKVSPQI